MVQYTAPLWVKKGRISRGITELKPDTARLRKLSQGCETRYETTQYIPCRIRKEGIVPNCLDRTGILLIYMRCLIVRPPAERVCAPSVVLVSKGQQVHYLQYGVVRIQSLFRGFSFLNHGGIFAKICNQKQSLKHPVLFLARFWSSTLDEFVPRYETAIDTFPVLRNDSLPLFFRVGLPHACSCVKRERLDHGPVVKVTTVHHLQEDFDHDHKNDGPACRFGKRPGLPR